jgi:hypothetical protein
MRVVVRPRGEPLELETLDPAPAGEPLGELSRLQANRARGTRSWFVAGVALVVGVVLGGSAMAVLDEHKSPTPRVPVVRHTPAPAQLGPFAALVGTWWQHSRELTISRNGVTTLRVRLRRECGLDACDAFVLTNLYSATIILQPMDHASTTGMLAASTDAHETPRGTTRLWVDPQRDLLYVVPFPGIKHPFCREHPYDQCGA